MDRSKLLRSFLTLLLVVALCGLTGGRAYADTFTGDGSGTTTAAGTTGQEVWVGATVGDGSASSDSGAGDGLAPPVNVLITWDPKPCDSDSGACVRPAPTTARAEPGAPTINDIATFPVTVGTAHNQPSGWGVVDRPTNFYAEGGIHEVSGTLLGNPATVRFTPVGWNWDYGDGVTASLASPGKPWSQAAQFRPTATSHVFTTKDDFTVTLFIDYTAEYQYAGQPWRPVAGALRVRANDLQIITWRVKTVLVAHDCIEDPDGPGCPGTLTR